MSDVLQTARLWLFTVIFPWVLSGSTFAQPVTTELVPHRAVYNLALERTSTGSNVTDIRGQLTYDFNGSPCEGYTLQTRLLTEIFDREGKPNITDIRSNSFERADAGHFRFNTSQYLNNQLSEATKGVALRKVNRGPVVVELEKPKRSAVKLSGAVFFPTQHSLAVLKSALAGQNRLHADLYDGSEKGAKVYATTTVIGLPLPPNENKKLPAVKNSDILNDMVSWPVVTSYYDESQNKEGLPTYEISFRLYANGVSRRLRLDYGTFSLSGELASIDFSKPRLCVKKRVLTKTKAEH